MSRLGDWLFGPMPTPSPVTAQNDPQPPSGPSSPDLKAGPVGPGAGPLMTEYLLPSVLATKDQDRLAQALRIGRSVDWVRAAERAIASRVVGCEWELKDPDDETIDDEWKGNPVALDALHLLEGPQDAIPIKEIGRRMSRRQFLSVSSRQMGMCGNAGWMLDMPDGNGLPGALLYIRPDRLTPICDKNGILLEWRLDKRPGFEGTKITIEELRLLQFEPPDIGIFGIGLIESSIAKATNNGLIDKHYSALLAGGGRISGIMSPKDGPITDDGVYKTLINDWRNIVEQPEAARRLQVVRAPIEFTQTVMSVAEMQIIDLMYHNRDALLALWGVPLSQLGGTAASGLNSGETRKYDEAAMWQAAVHDRLTEIGETYQSILDLWEPVLGWAPKFCWKEPEFDDETPAYERAARVKDQPLRNRERREILGLEPFGDPGLDEAIWMPAQVVAMAMAPDENGKIPPPSGIRMVDNPDPVAEEAGGMATSTPAKEASPGAPGATGTPSGGRGGTGAASAAQRGGTAKGDLSPEAGKAAFAGDTLPSPLPIMQGVLNVGTSNLRRAIDSRIVPVLTDTLEAALEAQRDAIAAAVEKNWASIQKHGGRDESMWWRDSRLEQVLRPAVTGIAEQVSEYISEILGPDGGN